ncbi:unnamed protein product, partial [Prorocentrum cordatum]
LLWSELVGTMSARWYYQVGPEAWLPFPDDACSVLEDRFLARAAANQPQSFQLQSGKYTYDVYLSDMLQINTSTGRRRSLDRRENQQQMQHSNQRITQLEASLEQSRRQEAEHRDQRDQLASRVAELQESEERLRAGLQREQLASQAASQRLTQEQTARADVTNEVRRLRADLEREQQAMKAAGRRLEEEQVARAEATRQARDAAAEMERLRQERGRRWEFQSHLGTWQPYDADSNAVLVRLHAAWIEEGSPDRDYEVTDRYHVNFGTMQQCSMRSGMLRPVRLQEYHGGAERIQLQAQSADLEANMGALADAFASLELQHGQATHQLEEATQEMAELRHAFDAVELERQQARDQLAEMSQEMTELRAVSDAVELERQQARDKVTQDMTELRAASDAVELERQHARDQLAEVTQEMTELHNVVNTLTLHRDQAIRDLAAEKAALDEARAMVRHEQTLEHLREDVARLNREKEQSEQKVELLNRESLDLQASLEKDRQHSRALEKTMQERRSEIDRLKDFADTRCQMLLQQVHHIGQVYNLSNVTRTDKSSEDSLRQTGSIPGLLGDRGKSIVVPAQVNHSKLKTSALSRSMLLNVFCELPHRGEYVPKEEQRLEPQSADFKFLELLFQSSCDSHRLQYNSEEWCEPPMLKIAEISTVTLEPKLLQQYSTNLDRICNRKRRFAVPVNFDRALRPITQKDASEYFLFHGCPWEAADQICKDGFHWKYAGTNTGAMFGQGIYFADRASKCDGYSTKDPDGMKRMVLARVALGNSLPRWRKCTDCKTEEEEEELAYVRGDRNGAISSCLRQLHATVPAPFSGWRHLRRAHAEAVMCDTPCPAGAGEPWTGDQGVAISDAEWPCLPFDLLGAATALAISEQMLAGLRRLRRQAARARFPGGCSAGCRAFGQPSTARQG